MGKPGPLDDGFANGVRFVFGAVFGLFIAFRLMKRQLILNFDDLHSLAAIIAVCACIALLCRVAAAKYRDEFWEKTFDVLFWWRR